MKEVTFKAEEIQQLATFIGEIPHKYGGPIDAFIKAVAAKRAQEASEATESEAEAPKTKSVKKAS